MINQGIALGYTNRRTLPAPVPVFMVYQTAFLGDDGRPSSAADVYQRDDEIWQHLRPAGQAPVAQAEPGEPTSKLKIPAARSTMRKKCSCLAAPTSLSD